METSPLMNGRQFARDFEDVIVDRWERLVSSQNGL
jgi:predicted O-linked N-acetylglucosamine transferase (SPINDLY family)